ncbi:MAG: hypothetical protein KDA89_04465, partial [Planctomycetaceae bacterium]|nr:hypothetical protein [Planctomycetaceae bacterium]
QAMSTPDSRHSSLVQRSGELWRGKITAICRAGSVAKQQTHTAAGGNPRSTSSSVFCLASRTFHRQNTRRFHDLHLNAADGGVVLPLGPRDW